MSDASFENLINAYLDNELSGDELARAQRLIADDASAAELFRSLQKQKARLGALPRYKLDNNFADRLMGSTEFENAFAKRSAGDRATVRQDAGDMNIGRSMKWKLAAGAIGSLAALIMVTLSINPAAMVGETELSMKDSAKSADSLTASRFDDDTSQDSYAADELLELDESGIQMKAGEAGLAKQSPSLAQAFEQKKEFSVKREEELGLDRQADGAVSPSPAKPRMSKKTPGRKQQMAESTRMFRGKSGPEEKLSDGMLQNEKFDNKQALSRKGSVAEADAERFESAKMGSNVLPSSGDSIGTKKYKKRALSATEIVEGQPAAQPQIAIGGQQVLEIVLPGKNAFGEYGFLAFQRALTKTGITFEGSAAGSTQSQSQMNQAIRLVAEPTRMKSLLTELANNRAVIRSYDTLGENESLQRLAVAAELRKRVVIQPQRRQRHKQSASQQNAGGVVNSGNQSQDAPGNKSGSAGFGGGGRIAIDGSVSGPGSVIEQQVDAAAGVDQSGQQLPKQYLLLIRIADPASK